MKLLTLFLASLVPSFSFAQSSWTRCSNGLPANQVLSLTHIGNTIYAGTDKGGVFQSSDFGQSWTTMPSHNSFTQTQTWSITAIDTFIFAGQRGNGILKISQNGSSWTLANSGLGNKVLQDLVAKGDTLLTATYGGGIYVSYDKAASWTSFHNNAGMDDRKIFSLAYNSTHWFTGTAGVNTYPDTGVAFRIPFNANTWEVINSGFIRNGVHLEGVFSMDADDQVVFAGTDDVGIFRSTDMGTNWTMVDNTADVHAIKIVGNDVFYGTSYAGIRTSHDKGLSWSTNNSGLVYNGQTLPYLVKDFLVLGNFIYAATDMGVFKQALSGNGSDISETNKSIQLFYSANRNSINISDGLSGSIELLNLNGQLIFSESISSSKSEYQLNPLTDGMYIVLLRNNDKITSRKIIVGN